MKIKKKILIAVVIILVVIGGYFSFSYYKHNISRIFSINKENINLDQSIKIKVENFAYKKLIKSRHLGDQTEFAQAKSNEKACSFLLYGYDDKYIYGFISCQFIDRSSTDGVLDIMNELNDPIRLKYLKPDFKIINYEVPTSLFSGDSGTDRDDILPPIYSKYFRENWNNSYMLLEKENIKKMLTDFPITKDIAIFLATEYEHYDLDSNTKINSLGAYPNGDADAIGDDKNGWNVVLYMYIEKDFLVNNQTDSFMASCYRVAPSLFVELTGEYVFPKETPVKEINPITCLVK